MQTILTFAAFAAAGIVRVTADDRMLASTEVHTGELKWACMMSGMRRQTARSGRFWSAEQYKR